MRKTLTIHVCDFCHKGQHEVVCIVVGRDDVAICNECVNSALESVQENLKAGASVQPGGEAMAEAARCAEAAAGSASRAADIAEYVASLRREGHA